MWTSKNRARYKRDHLRYPSDVTDEEWAHVGPLIPPAKRGGRKREVDARDVVDGIMYVLSTGCQWRYIPKDLPPRSTVYRYFCLWGYDGTLDRIHYALYEKCREQAGREASPTAAIIDSQSVKRRPWPRFRTQLETEIVKRSDCAKGFVVLPRRWIVERTIAWLNRCRRLAKDWENLNLSGLIFLRFASIRLMLRKLCNP